jgi:hypothetical protein
MISRIPHLLVIGILAVGVAIRRGADAETILPGPAAQALDGVRIPDQGPEPAAPAWECGLPDRSRA